MCGYRIQVSKISPDWSLSDIFRWLNWNENGKEPLLHFCQKTDYCDSWYEQSLKKHLYGIVLKYICMLLFLPKTDSVKGFNLTWGGGRQNGLTLHNMLPLTKPRPTLHSYLHPPIKSIKLSQLIYYLKFIEVLSWNKYLINVLKTEQLLVKKKKKKMDIIKGCILLKTFGEISLS